MAAPLPETWKKAENTYAIAIKASKSQMEGKETREEELSRCEKNDAFFRLLEENVGAVMIDGSNYSYLHSQVAQNLQYGSCCVNE